MKNFLWKVLKWLMLLTYPVILVILGVVAFMYLQKDGEINSALNEYTAMYEEFSIAGERRGDVVNAMRDVRSNVIAGLNMEIEALREENRDLKGKIDKGEGYGEIQGSILPFVSDQFGLEQYQRVCAQRVDNENVQYCVSASAVRKDYVLSLPSGDYHVFAQIQNTEDISYRAFYTEFVQCNRDESARCSASLSDKKVVVTVSADAPVLQVDPIDWGENISGGE